MRIQESGWRYDPRTDAWIALAGAADGLIGLASDNKGLVAVGDALGVHWIMTHEPGHMDLDEGDQGYDDPDDPGGGGGGGGSYGGSGGGGGYGGALGPFSLTMIALILLGRRSLRARTNDRSI